MRREIFATLLLLTTTAQAEDVTRDYPQEWIGVVEGGRFQDRFLPMQGEVLSSEVWGDEGVLPRYIDNGIEDNIFSYWGGNIIEENGVFHQFLCGWLESNPRGHMNWSNSIIFHTVSASQYGPFKLKDIVGAGHNPDIYRAKNGEYIIATSIKWNPKCYVSKSLEGPWVLREFQYDDRDRGILDEMSNLGFTKREDGSLFMVCRGGGIWISQDGVSPFMQISDKSVYPDREGCFEDPEIWRDNVQYNLIVNDWLGRVAYYMRSHDGLHWVEDAGEAYTPGVAFHEDGKVEEWYKFERIKIFQDEERRAVQANFAVCDAVKRDDMGSDNHSSKNISLPLNRGVLMEIIEPKIEPKMKCISIRIKAEEDFKPFDQLNIKSLRFGRSKDVNFGRGCSVSSTSRDGEDMIITFNTKGYVIPDSEFAPKLLGRDTSGGVLFGYARNPNVDFTPALLSYRKPYRKGDKWIVTVENFGLKSSEQSRLQIKIDGKRFEDITIPELKPYGKFDAVVKGANINWQSHVEIDIITPISTKQ